MYIREDWKLFRNIETLPQKAGVSKDKLGLLIAKELTDNALDACGHCEVGFIGDNGFYIEDNGIGIDIEKLPELFSINRPLMTTKLLRLPTRGALGNGLRVVAGTIVASGGTLLVSTKGKTFKMKMQDNGRTLAKFKGDYHEIGTKIEVYPGNSIKSDLSWALDAIKYAGGEYYKGKTSGYWYTSEAFFELLQGNSESVRDIIFQFDGCTGTKAGRILSDFKNRKSNTLSWTESEKLLLAIRENSKKVNPDRLGQIGQLDGYGYCKSAGEFKLDSAKGDNNAEIPFVIEAWVDYNQEKDIKVLVNKTPITGEINLYGYKNNKASIGGCGIYELLNIKPAKIIINIITPYMPITSDGKEPDLRLMASSITETINKAGKKAKKFVATVKKSLSQKDIILENLNEAIAKASGNGEYRFSQRQLYYAIRPYVISKLGRELEYGYFCGVITDYEAENGDIGLMYRDNRGTLYHPHLGQDISVGTIAVENYERPKWTFNKVLYIEKEGFFNILKDNKIPEKYDMALLTSKGYASRAVKDLLDSMSNTTEEEITFFCIHDADAAGTKIFETLQEETKARPGRKVNIINLGLEPEEAISMGLEVERVDKGSRDKAVADYVELEWKQWLQSNRVELNAMPTPQFLEWLESKIGIYDKGKVVPPNAVIEEKMDRAVKGELSKIISDKILRENQYEAKVNKVYAQLKSHYADRILEIRKDVIDKLEYCPTDIWKDVVANIADETVMENFKKWDF